MQTVTSNLSPGAARWIRISAIITMLIVALSSAVLSFDGLQKLALASQVPQHLAFLFPIAVDMTILMGSLAVLLYEMFGLRARFGWFTVLFGTALSVTGNVISVSDAGLIAQILHGIIPILLCISLESLLRILRFNIRNGHDGGVASLHVEEDKKNPAEDKEPSELAEQESLGEKGQEPPLTAGHTSTHAEIAPTASAHEVSAEPVPALTPVAEVAEPIETSVALATQEKDTESRTSLSPEPGDDWLVNARAKLDEMTLARNVSSEDTQPVTPIEPEPEETLIPAPDNAPVPTVNSSEVNALGAVSKTPARQPAPAQNKESASRPVSEKKVPAKKRPASTVPPLEDYEKEDFKALIEAMPEDTPAVQKLGSVFKIKDTMPAADVRWLLGYEDGKRVDSLMRRARDWAAEN